MRFTLPPTTAGQQAFELVEFAIKALRAAGYVIKCDARTHQLVAVRNA